MKVMTPETKVGFLTLAAIAALLYMALKVSGFSWFGADYPSFSMRFKSVAGMELQSKVKLSGVEIGFIKDIILEEGKARVVAQMTRDANIRNDAVATISTSGLLGEKYIEIIQGTPDQPLLQDGESLVNTQEAANIGDVISKLGKALDDITAVTGSLNNAFGTVGSGEKLRNILENVDIATANMSELLAENKEGFSVMVSNFSEISDAFSESAPDVASKLKEIADGLYELIEANKENITAGVANLRELTAEFKGILGENRANLKNIMENVSNASGKIDDAISSVKNMSSSFENVATKIERGEGTIGKLVTDEEVYNNLNATLEGAGDFLGQADELSIKLGLRGERLTDQDESRAFVTVELWPREDSFYRVEVSEDIRRRDLPKTHNTLNSVLWTVLAAKRFSDITIRGGLIESSAGLGLDYHMFDQRVILTGEVFNLSGYDEFAVNPQVKAMLRYNFLKYLYLHIGGDELANEEYRTFLIGGGILFDDDAIKFAFKLL